MTVIHSVLKIQVQSLIDHLYYRKQFSYRKLESLTIYSAKDTDFYSKPNPIFVHNYKDNTDILTNFKSAFM